MQLAQVRTIYPEFLPELAMMWGGVEGAGCHTTDLYNPTHPLEPVARNGRALE